MILTAKQIAEAARGKLFGDPSATVNKIATDSREDFSDGGLFAAIKGEKTDGHLYIEQAVKNGATAVLLSDERYIPPAEKISEGTSYILTDDVATSFLKIGEYCRNQIHIPIVSVTGSVGKTTTREMIAKALSAELKTFKTKKNYNGQIGIPVTLFNIADEQVAVIEAGISIPGEMNRIASVIRPNVVVMTNIGVSHIEYLGSREGIFKEKFNLARSLGSDGCLIVNGDDDILGAINPAEYPFQVIKCGFYKTNDVRAEEVAQTAEQSLFTAVFDSARDNTAARIRVPVRLSMLGKHMIIDALLALAVARVMKTDVFKAAEKLADYNGYEGRQRVEISHGVRFICDYYNASPDSMRAALSVLKEMDCEGRKIAILGDMNELGPDSATFHREIGEAVIKSGVDILLTVGEKSKDIAKGSAACADTSDMIIRSFDDVTNCGNFLSQIAQSKDIVLLKASNSIKLGTVKEIWERDKSTQK